MPHPQVTIFQIGTSVFQKVQVKACQRFWYKPREQLRVSHTWVILTEPQFSSW